MKRLLHIFCTLLLVGSVSSCTKEKTTPPTPPRQISGAVQKGPFITGTSIVIRPLNERLEPTGASYETQITDDLGNFTFPTRIDAAYAELIANGYYFNEVENRLSRSQITLRSITRPSERGNNINLLTTLEAERLRYLVQKQGRSFEEARQTAQREVLASFGITLKESTVSDGMDISQNGEGNAALLAVSAIMQFSHSEAELTELIAKVANDIRDNGNITQTALRKVIRQGQGVLDAEDIRKTLTDRYTQLGLTDFHVPDIYSYLDYDDDGILNGAEPYILAAKDNLVMSSLQDTVSVTIHTNVKWTATVPAEAKEWLSIDGRTTDDLLVLIAKPNDGAPRTATLTLKETNGSLVETVDVMQVGNEIRVQLKLAARWAGGSGTQTETIAPELEGMLDNLTFIYLSRDQVEVNRLIQPVTDDALEFSMPFGYVNNDNEPVLVRNTCVIANDAESWKTFTGKENIEDYRSTRDLNATDAPQPLIGFADIFKPDYTKPNLIPITFTRATAKIAFTLKFAAELGQPEVLSFTAHGINSKCGKLYPSPYYGELDTLYRNDYVMEPTVDNQYTFYVYNQSSIRGVTVKVRIDGTECTYKVTMSQTDNPGAPIVFRSGYSYNYRVTISGGGEISSRFE